MAENKFVKANEEIAETVVSGYKKIEDGVVGGYKKIEEGVVDGFTRMTDKFVGGFLTRDGETVEDAKARLAEEQKAREEAGKAAAEKRVRFFLLPDRRRTQCRTLFRSALCFIVFSAVFKVGTGFACYEKQTEREE